MSADDSTANPTALVGHSIAGKFVIEALIAQGGAGTVYRARQLALDRIVALKVLHQEVARDGHFVERFKREARAASRLDHPNSVRVFDFGYVDESLLYLAMEYVEGRTLHDVIAEQWPLGDARIVDILSQVLSAVAVAHEMGVIHRDLKPDNIMIIQTRSDDGEDAELAKVCDFGIATLGALQPEGGAERTAGPWATNDGTLVGTPGYMSPEQARGEQADARSDIYSAGVILYHMLTGRPPFEGETAYFVAMKHITEAPTPPSVHGAVNPQLEAVCLRALSKVPGDRFASARDMRAVLRAALARSTPAGALAAASETPRPQLLTPRPRVESPDTLEVLKGAGVGASARRHRTIAALLGFAAIATVAGAFAARSMQGASRAQTRPTAAAVAAAVAPPPPAPPPPIAETAPAAAPSERAVVKAADAPPDPATKSRAASPGPAAKSATARPIRARQARERGLVRAADVEARPIPATAPAAAPAPAPVAVAPTTPPAPVAAAKPPTIAAAKPPTIAAAKPPTIAAAPSPAVATPAPRIDVERATASITGVTTTSAIPGSNVRAALGRVPIARCYRDALRAGALTSGTATLHLRIDGAGYVTGASLQGAGLPPALRSCIEKAATTAVRIKDVDTGEATADVTLSFVAAP